jgi:broad specificity phosphatase PhoE
VPKIILAKHAMPQVQSPVPAHRWHLGAEGIAGARRLGERLREYGPSRIVSSREPKAMETAAIVAEVLGLTHGVEDDLHEHERPEPGLLGADEFQRKVEALFARPADVAFGAESAATALRRFAVALDRIAARELEMTVIVTHGTVISLFAAEHGAGDGFALWKRLGLPSFLVFETPGWTLTEIAPSL